MCELLGLCASRPTDMCFSLTGFVQRGGTTGPHKDGFGMGFFGPGGYRDFHDDLPAAVSPVARLLCEYPIQSTIALGQVRQANVGEVRIDNTYPFTREVGGRYWSYVMHGQLQAPEALALDGPYQPLGSTDGERAFCWLLERIRNQQATGSVTLPQMLCALHRWCEQLDGSVHNMLLSEGQRLYVYCSTHLAYITRRAPFGQAALKDTAYSVDFGVGTDEALVATVVATHPLTDEAGWHYLKPGQLAVFENGELIASVGEARRAG